MGLKPFETSDRSAGRTCQTGLQRHSGESRNPVGQPVWVLTEACARESGCQDDVRDIPLSLQHPHQLFHEDAALVELVDGDEFVGLVCLFD